MFGLEFQVYAHFVNTWKELEQNVKLTTIFVHH